MSDMLECHCADVSKRVQRSTLRTLLAINLGMFFVEALAGWWGDSAGLIADSLDMIADAAVYGIALYAVGGSSTLKTRSALASGWLQVVLGVGVLGDVARRIAFGCEPASAIMMSVGAVALVANVTCLVLLAKHREGEIHMRASWIFSTNDVIANVGVIVSGFLVMFSGSHLPDLVIGTLVSAAVVRGGCRIIAEAGHQPPSCESSDQEARVGDQGSIR